VISLQVIAPTKLFSWRENQKMLGTACRIYKHSFAKNIIPHAKLIGV